jgi:hypothetical protein
MTNVCAAIGLAPARKRAVFDRVLAFITVPTTEKHAAAKPVAEEASFS